MITNSSIVDVRVDFPSATVILNRPAAKNALNSESLKKLRLAFSDLHQEKKVSAVIVTGAGDSFSAGVDLKEVQSNLEAENSQEKWQNQLMAMNELLEVLLRFPKPIIAAVNGPALGFGFALALSADLLIAGPTATFGCPEIKRGLVPGLAAPLLAFRLGSSLAAKYCLTAETVTAKQANQDGFCHEIVSKTDLLWARAHEIAKGMAENCPQAVQMTKKLLNETIGEEFLTHLNLGTANSAAARTTEAAKEGLNAFHEKRPPSWP